MTAPDLLKVHAIKAALQSRRVLTADGIIIIITGVYMHAWRSRVISTHINSRCIGYYNYYHACSHATFNFGNVHNNSKLNVYACMLGL